jgi:hypothetical protein
MCVKLPTSSPKLQCKNILLLVAHTPFFCRAANGIATQMKSHRYAPALTGGEPFMLPPALDTIRNYEKMKNLELKKKKNLEQ